MSGVKTGITDKRMLFLGALAKQVSPLTADDSAKAMIPLLSAVLHIPEGVFEDPVALGVRIGSELERIPNAAKLRKLLDAEAARLKPMLSLPYPDEPGLSDEDRLWIKGWENGRHHKSPPRSAYLDVLRQKAPLAFEVLCRDDDEARDIAVRRGWGTLAVAATIAAMTAADWREPERVRLSLMKIDLMESPSWRVLMLRLLRAALTKHAPDNLPMLDRYQPPAEPVPPPERASFSAAVPPTGALVSASGMDW